MRIEGYTLLSWYDRADGRQGGGVAVFALDKLDHKVTHLGDSTVAEKSWVISDLGPTCLVAGIDLAHLERLTQFAASRKSYRRMPQKPWEVLCLVISTSIIGGG